MVELLSLPLAPALLTGVSSFVLSFIFLVEVVFVLVFVFDDFEEELWSSANSSKSVLLLILK
jgi:hypothetical protein